MTETLIQSKGGGDIWRKRGAGRAIDLDQVLAGLPAYDLFMETEARRRQ
jgi:hypothetical protein